MKNPFTLLLFGIIRLYQLLISPFIGRHCRYYPTCSSYMMQAVKKYGLLKGGWMGIKRIGRCSPWHPGGHDPVP